MHPTEKADSGRTVNLKVTGSDPLEAPSPLFANFLAVSHAGTDVQLEFIFMDLNEIAKAADKLKAGTSGTIDFHGQTVAKVVMPTAAFLQIENHLSTVFDRLKGEPNEAQKATTERKNATGKS